MPEDLGKATDPFTSAFCNDTSQEDVFSLTVYHPSLWPNISRYQLIKSLPLNRFLHSLIKHTSKQKRKLVHYTLHQLWTKAIKLATVYSGFH